MHTYLPTYLPIYLPLDCTAHRSPFMVSELLQQHRLSLSMSAKGIRVVAQWLYRCSDTKRPSLEATAPGADLGIWYPAGDRRRSR